MSNKPNITFDSSVTHLVIDVFDWQTDESGVVLDSDGNPAPTLDNGPITIDEVGGIVDDEHGNAVLIRNNVTDIGEYVDRIVEESNE